MVLAPSGNYAKLQKFLLMAAIMQLLPCSFDLNLNTPLKIQF